MKTNIRYCDETLEYETYVGHFGAISTFSGYPTITTHSYLRAVVRAHNEEIPAVVGSRYGDISFNDLKLYPGDVRKSYYTTEFSRFAQGKCDHMSNKPSLIVIVQLRDIHSINIGKILETHLRRPTLATPTNPDLADWPC